MKYIHIKLFFTAVLINLLPLILGALGCSGKGCLIIFIALAYWIICLVAYLPYLFINTSFINSKIDRIVVFFLPTVLLIVILSLFGLGDFNKNAAFYSVLLIPNIVIQIILFMYYQYKKENRIAEIIQKLKKWNAT